MLNADNSRIRRWIRILFFTWILCLSMTLSANAAGEIKNRNFIRKSDATQIIFVGDSNTLFADFCSRKVKRGFILLGVNGGNVGVIDRGGSIRTALEQYIRKYPKAAVVFAFGKNGNGAPRKNARRCIRIYDSFIKKYPRTKFFAASIIPNNSRAKGSYSNEKIQTFNTILREKYAKTGQYISVNEYLMKNLNNDFRKSVNGKPARYGYFNSLHLNRIGSTILLRYVRKAVQGVTSAAS